MEIILAKSAGFCFGVKRATQMAFDATQTALELSIQTTPLEQALIAALKARYPKRTIDANMAEWDRNFAQVMRVAFNAHSNSLDMLSIYVEALLNCTPWKMWEISTGNPAAGAYTIDAMEQLERAFATQPHAMQHPGLLHLYIHLMEMSPFPERAQSLCRFERPCARCRSPDPYADAY